MNFFHHTLMSDEQRAVYMKEKRKRDAFKTEMCKAFLRQGHCQFGNDCRFAHRTEELRVRSVHPRYKTELCRNFSLYGICIYGARCQFIHRTPRYPGGQWPLSDFGMLSNSHGSGEITSNSAGCVTLSKLTYNKKTTNKNAFLPSTTNKTVTLSVEQHSPQSSGFSTAELVRQKLLAAIRKQPPAIEAKPPAIDDSVEKPLFDAFKGFQLEDWHPFTPSIEKLFAESNGGSSIFDEASSTNKPSGFSQSCFPVFTTSSSGATNSQQKSP
jgi:hypothetical protein